MFGLNNSQKQINDSLKPINSRLDSHSELLDEMIRFKCECTEHRRRFEDKLMIIEENQEKICKVLEEAKVYHEKNSENLQTLTDVIITAKTGKKSIPWIMSLIGIITVIISGVVIGVEYIQTTIATLLK